MPQDGRIKVRIEDNEVDIRVSVIPMLHGEAVVMRLLRQNSTLRGLSQIGLGPRELECFRRVLDLPHGIVLVTGPTGSGKTSTLYTALNEINDEVRKIITIEDPVEYQLRGVNQIQVSEKAGLTFARGLRSILRHDPDVVLIGEIRDRETAQIAVQASLTGHLVFDPPYQRRSGSRDPTGRHGRRAVFGRLLAGGRLGPATGPCSVPGMQSPGHVGPCESLPIPHGHRSRRAALQSGRVPSLSTNRILRTSRHL